MKLNTSIRKRFRVSNKVKKVASKDRFRLCIFRSSKNISAQIIDDINKVTLLSASSVEKDIKSGDKVNKTELSKIVATKLAKKAHHRCLIKALPQPHAPGGRTLRASQRTCLHPLRLSCRGHLSRDT